MDWVAYSALAALFIGVWHEINRFPAANRSFRKLQERLDQAEWENQDLKRQVESLDSEVESLVKAIRKIQDPVYYQALEEGDGMLLHDLDKYRNGEK